MSDLVFDPFERRIPASESGMPGKSDLFLTPSSSLPEPARESNVRLGAFSNAASGLPFPDWQTDVDSAKFGVTIHGKGATFRFLAPQADRASVVGSFNAWNVNANPLTRYRDGSWVGWVKDAAIGDQYRFRSVTAGRVCQRIDPRARHVSSEAGAGIISDPSFDWSVLNFSVPPLNRMVIRSVDFRSLRTDLDGKPAGTIDDLTDELDVFVQRGFNAIQITPQSRCATTPMAIEDVDGGPNALRLLVDSAHARGIAIIIKVDDLGTNWMVSEGWQSSTRAQVRAFVRDTAMIWFAEYHVDGLRFRTTDLMRSFDVSSGRETESEMNLLPWINREIRNSFPSAVTIAEDQGDNEFVTKPDVEGGEGFTSQVDEGFRNLRLHSLDSTDIANICKLLYDGFNCDVFQRMIELGYESIQDRKEQDLIDTLLLTSPGIPVSSGTSEFLGELIQLRLNRNGDSAGLSGQIVDVFHINDKARVIAFRRTESGGAADDVIVVINFCDQVQDDYPIGMPEAGTWCVRLSNFAAPPEIVATDHHCDHQVAGAIIRLEPFGVLILSKDSNHSS